MDQRFTSPIERLAAEGKLVPVPEAHVRRLTDHLNRTYVPTMERYRREQAALAARIRDILLF